MKDIHGYCVINNCVFIYNLIVIVGGFDGGSRQHQKRAGRHKAAAVFDSENSV